MKAFYFHPWENHFRPLSLKCPFYLPKFCSERTASKDLPNINNLGVLLTSSWHTDFDLIVGRDGGLRKAVAMPLLAGVSKFNITMQRALTFLGQILSPGALISFYVKWSNSVSVVLNSLPPSSRDTCRQTGWQTDIHSFPTPDYLRGGRSSPCQRHLSPGLGQLPLSCSQLPLHLLESLLRTGATQLDASAPSGICSKVSFSARPSSATLSKIRTVMLAAQYSLHPFPTLFHSFALITAQYSLFNCTICFPNLIISSTKAGICEVLFTTESLVPSPQQELN